MRKMRKLNKALVEKIVDNTWHTTRKYEYFYDNLIIKRIEICDLDTTAVYDVSRCDLYDMYGNPIDRNLVELSYARGTSDMVVEKVYG